MLCKRDSVLQLMQLTDELQSATTEKDNLLAEKSKDDLDNKAELESHRVCIASLTEERDQMREENEQLKTELEETNEKVRTQKATMRNLKRIRVGLFNFEIFPHFR